MTAASGQVSRKTLEGRVVCRIIKEPPGISIYWGTDRGKLRLRIGLCSSH